MGTVSISLPVDGTNATVSQYNTPITTIVTAINGNLDSGNISSLNGTKITSGTLPGSALDTTTAAGYISGLVAPNSVTYNGNRSYSLVFNSVNYSTILSPGMRLRTTRTVAAPTQCTNLNGSNQYYNKSSPAGMTFTNFPVAYAHVYLSSYGVADIESRYNGTSGWRFYLNSSGQVVLQGYNAGSANFNSVTSYQSISLNKKVHLAAQLDMSTSTLDSTHSYIMIDGISVPCFKTSGGTNPTALIQAGNYEIGSNNGGTNPFPGKLAQVAIFSAAVTQSTILGYISQSLAGTETSLISAYSFNNTISDLNVTNVNNLTANGSAVATNADSPFGGQAGGTISSTLDYAIVQSTAYSTNTTVVVQVAEGCTIPTSGGVSTVIYSSNKAPYGMPIQLSKWTISTTSKSNNVQSAPTINTWYGTANGTPTLAIPIGEWLVSQSCELSASNSASVGVIYATVSTSTSAETVIELTSAQYLSSANSVLIAPVYRQFSQSVPSMTLYYHIFKSDTTITSVGVRSDIAPLVISAQNALL